MKAKKGFTLVELIMSLGILAIILMLVFNTLNTSIVSESMVDKQYRIQTGLRKTLDKTNEVIRYSKGIFAVPESFLGEKAMDSRWSYLMVSPDKKRLVVMSYDRKSDRFIEEVLIGEEDNIEYSMVFVRGVNSEKILDYQIRANILRRSGDEIEKIGYQGRIEGINTVQIVDKGSKSNPSKGLAFTKEGYTSGKGNTEIAYISMILDKSGSMDEVLKSYVIQYGRYCSEGKGHSHSQCRCKFKEITRMDDLKDSLLKENGILDILAKEDNIYLSLIPFDTLANTTGSFNHKALELKDNKELIKSQVRGLRASGGTNTGDALRRAYNNHLKVRQDLLKGSNININHYMILLVDGETTFELRQVKEWGKYGGYWNYYWEANSLGDFYFGDGNVSEVYTNRRYKNKPNVSYGITGSGNKPILSSSDIKYDINRPNIFSHYEKNTYVYSLGQKIKSYNIKPYVIGYNTGSGFNKQVNLLAGSIGTSKDNIYKYDDKDFNLEDIFKSIANDIMADHWLVSGPEIK